MRKYLNKFVFVERPFNKFYRDNRCHEHVIVRFVSTYVISAFPREDVWIHITSLTPPPSHDIAVISKPSYKMHFSHIYK